jgi:hypothetical protein
MEENQLLKEDYDDNYPTCCCTSVLLYISNFSKKDEDSQDYIINLLNIDESQIKTRDLKYTRRWSCSIFSSENEIVSKDIRRHLDWLLDIIYPKKQEILALDKKYNLQIWCYWHSTQGHGGPTLSPKQMGKIAELNIKLAFYF